MPIHPSRRKALADGLRVEVDAAAGDSPPSSSQLAQVQNDDSQCHRCATGIGSHTCGKSANSNSSRYRRQQRRGAVVREEVLAQTVLGNAWVDAGKQLLTGTKRSKSSKSAATVATQSGSGGCFAELNSSNSSSNFTRRRAQILPSLLGSSDAFRATALHERTASVVRARAATLDDLMSRSPSTASART